MPSSRLFSESRVPASHLAAWALIALSTVIALYAVGRAGMAALDLTRDPLPATTPVAIETLLAEQRQVPSLAGFHLFGALNAPIDLRTAAGTLPDTTLALTVLGVIAADNPKLGLAILRGADTPERQYRVGDEIAAGVTLDSVLPDRILLSRNGALEALRLPREILASSPQVPAASADAGSAPSPLPSASGGAGGPAAASGQPAAFVNPVMSAGAVDWNQAIDQLKADPDRIARDVSALPVIEDGRMVGVRLNAGPQQALVAAFGLRPDDVVTAVNGIALDSPARAAEVARALASASGASVTVRRDGRLETLSVTLPR